MPELVLDILHWFWYDLFIVKEKRNESSALKSDGQCHPGDFCYFPDRRLEFAVNSKGFTLIELMICVALVAIFSAIILSSYQKKTLQTTGPLQAERVELVNPAFTTKCYNGVLYFTTTNSFTGAEYPTAPVISIDGNPDRLRPTLCK